MDLAIKGLWATRSVEIQWIFGTIMVHLEVVICFFWGCKPN